MPKITFSQLFNIFLILILNVFSGIAQFNKIEDYKRVDYIDLLIPEPIPILSENFSNSVGPNTIGRKDKSQISSTKPQITAESYLVLDVGSSAVLIEKNSLLPFYPASTIKMMTALVARDLYNLDDGVIIDQRSLTEGNTIGLQLGEEITVRKLLMGMLISSGNDSALALAANHPSGVEKFVEKMNEKAVELNLTNSYFDNPVGLDSTWQRSTARDLAVMALELIKDPYFKELIAIKEVVITDREGVINHKFVNTNALLGTIDGVKGIKTGTTPLAGQVLVTLVDRSDHSYIIVLMNSQQRYDDTKQLIKYIDENYIWLDYNSL